MLASAPVVLTDSCVSSVVGVTAFPSFPAVAGISVIADVPVVACVPVVVGFPKN